MRTSIQGMIPIFAAFFIQTALGADLMLAQEYKDQDIAGWAMSEKLDGVRRDLPIIVLDHRPGDILAHVQTALDIQVSGHTHNGQIFPANFIVQAMYRLAYGHENIEGKEVFVSSGYGFWGVPLRLGSRSEIFVIEVNGIES